MQVQCRLMKERWSYDALILITEVGDRVGIGFSLTLTRPPIITQPCEHILCRQVAEW